MEASVQAKSRVPERVPDEKVQREMREGGQGLRIGRRIRLYRVQQRCEPSRLEYVSSVHWSLITLVLC